MSLQEIDACLLSTKAIAVYGINFGTVTGGQDYAMGNIAAKQREGVAKLPAGDSQLLTDSDWCCAVIYPHQANMHISLPLLPL